MWNQSSIMINSCVQPSTTCLLYKALPEHADPIQYGTTGVAFSTQAQPPNLSP